MTLKEKAESQINSLKDSIHKSGFHTDRIVTRDYNHEFNAVDGKQRVKVQIFFGKKGIKKILQGDINSTFYKTISNLISEQQSLDLIDIDIIEPDEYIGSDEVGKGDFFGPLVVAAVYVNNSSKLALTKIGIRDSKDISDPQIKLFAKEIKSVIKNDFEIVKINPDKYNELYDKFKNLNKLLDWAHSKAIENLIDNRECKYVITDKFGKKDLNLVSKYPDVNFVAETKAEKYIGVAAASILARTSFLEWFDSQLKKGFKLPKGASGQVEDYAKALIKKISRDELKTIAKLHFKTYSKIKSN
ncbi:MAG: ribonuclease HIII [Melioribacter sp.]|nr:ribonuclease HIII [Melioribacter sp.]